MSVYTVDFDKMLDQLASNLEISRPSKYHTETDLKRYINLGIIEMAKRTKVVRATKFLYLSASVARYSVPTDSLRGEIDQVLYLKSGTLTGSQFIVKKVDRRSFQAITPMSNSGILSTVIYQTPGTGAPTHYLLENDVIEFRPIPTSAYAGANKICLKGPGVPDQLSATSAVPDIPVEHRMVPVLYGTYLGQLKDKDPRYHDSLAQFYAECDEINATMKFSGVEDPPSILPESFFNPAEWGPR